MDLFNTDYVLEDDFALLRPIVANDYDNLLHFALNEPNIWHYSLVSASGVEGMRRYIDTAIAARKAEHSYAFIVYDKRQNSYAGSTRYYDIALNKKTLEIGYTWYAPAFQGTGLNQHCKYLLLSFAFDILKMERVSFKADNDNKRSIAAMQGIGCTIEGVLRQDSLKADGTRRNTIVLSILRHEWYGTIQTMLKNKLK